MIKTIIFDFNGTLLDDLQINFEIFNVLAKDFDAKSITMEEYREVFDFPVIECYRKWGFDVEGEKFSIIADKFHFYYNALVYEKCSIFENALSLLNELKGRYNLICLSATKKETLDMQLKHYNIYDYFDEVIGMSDKYAHGKIALAKGWLKNSKYNNKEILFVGDTLHDLEVAKALDVECVLVSNGHNSKSKLKKSCDKVLDDIIEIKKYLE